MNNKGPNSRILQELLKKHQQKRQETFGDIDDFEPPKFFVNSHNLYQEAHAKITAEQDINLVREIALDYIDSMCSVLPDNISTAISQQMNGL